MRARSIISFSPQFFRLAGQLSCLFGLALWLFAPPMAFAGDFESLQVSNLITHRAITLMMPKTALTPDEVAVVINDLDPQSVAVGNYYQSKRHIPAQNMIHVSFAIGSDDITFPAFLSVRSAIRSQLLPVHQAIAITFTQPYRVGGCSSTTSVLTFNVNACDDFVAAGLANTYFHNRTSQPYRDLGIRPAMVLAGTDPSNEVTPDINISIQNVKNLIDRGVASDGTYPGGDAYYLRSSDNTRNMILGDISSLARDWNQTDGLVSYFSSYADTNQDYIYNKNKVLFYFVGEQAVFGINSNTFRPGALAFHPTSFGGQLVHSGQMSILRWLEGGAVASFGTVVEPTISTAKFPQPPQLTHAYFTGRNALAAYWSSVQIVSEGIFAGEPLARPYGPALATLSIDNVLTIETTFLEPHRTYALMAGNSANGPFSTLQSPVAGHYQLTTIVQPNATNSFYKLVDTTPATVPLTLDVQSPTPNATLSGTVTIVAHPSDDSANMVAQADGTTMICQVGTPFRCEWNTRQMPNGTHNLYVVLYDDQNHTVSTIVPVTISNSGADSTPPTVTMTSPIAGATASGTIAVQASAADDTGVSSVSLLIDDTLVTSKISAPYNFNFDTTAILNGTHTLTVRATDAANNRTSVSRDILVNNIDSTNPTVTFNSPATGVQLTGVTTVQVTPADNVGVKKVIFYIDDIQAAVRKSAPYSFSWDTAITATGTRTLKALTIDGAGNQGSATRSVTVGTGLPIAPQAPHGFVLVPN